MSHLKRPFAFWVITCFLIISLILLLMGQTMAVINYDYAVQLGLQESINDVGAFGVQMNRAIGAADSLIYIPLIALSITGLILKKRWALLTTAAVLGISAYWATTASFLLTLLAGVPGYYFEPGFDYWLIITIYIIFHCCPVN